VETIAIAARKTELENVTLGSVMRDMSSQATISNVVVMILLVLQFANPEIVLYIVLNDGHA